MRFIVALTLWALPCALVGQTWEDRRLFNEDASGQPIRIISSTDLSLFAPIIEGFIAEHPNASVEYLVAGTTDTDQIFRANPGAFDLVISSAMDLQFKAANDGLGLRLPGVTHPSWAQWHQTLFAFTSEPAAIVVNRAAFSDHPVPNTRQELIEAIRARPEVFRRRVGTYDVRKSGLGYLFATQDARASETYWRLMEVMGAADVQLYCCSGAMIDDLSDGTILVAYNVLGSYAQARIESHNLIEIILPADFPTTMMRTAMVSRKSSRPDLATEFIEHLISLPATTDGDTAGLPALAPNPDTADRATIALEPALMTFLDTLKRRRFIAEWENALIQTTPDP